MLNLVVYRWALGLIVRGYVMLNLIAECSCLAHVFKDVTGRLVTALPLERIITVCRVEESLFREAG